MLKKFFLLLIVAMLNVVALWADPAIEITHNDASWVSAELCYKVHVGEAKFVEPTIKVKDGSSYVTSNYIITYSISDAATNGNIGTESTDARGVVIVTDDNASSTDKTESYVEKYYGDVVMGKSGTVYVQVTATPKTGSGTLTGSYKIVISGNSPTVNFTPAFATAESPYDGKIILNTIQGQWGTYAKAVSVLPQCKITTTANGVTKDITSCYDITVTLNQEEANKSNGTLVKSDKNGYDLIQLNQGASAPASVTGSLTYSFALKSEYTGLYDAIADKSIQISVEIASAKKNLTLELTRESFNQEAVNNSTSDPSLAATNVGDYTVHVYKYGKSDTGSNNNYRYITPRPTLKTADGQVMPIYGISGGWNDFRYVCEIIEDNTYYDDCDYDYFTKRGSVQLAGEKTDLTIGAEQFQVAKPGLVKVRMWAVMDKVDYYGVDSKAIYQAVQENDADKIIKIDGTEYIVFAQPVEFYIDVMKRKPFITMTPNPIGMTFLKGDKIEMDSRFEISAYIDDRYNGEAGELEFGANTGGAEHFRYSFFITDRIQTGHIKMYWKNMTDENGDILTSWSSNGGDEHAYYDWFPTAFTTADNKAVQVNDMIKTGGTISFTASADYDVRDHVTATPNMIGQTVEIDGHSIVITPDNVSILMDVKKGQEINLDEYVIVTSENLSSYSSRVLNTGDYEHGITYHSMKGWGNENWSMEFLENGDYTIPYVVNPWNHTRWDKSDIILMTYKVVDVVDTKILLSYYHKVVRTSEATAKPDNWVVVPSWNNYDVTTDGNFTFTYAKVSGPAGSDVNTTTGELTIGATSGTLVVRVSATRGYLITKYNNPESVTYSIRIASDDGMARWEVISGCRNTGACDEHGTNPRFADIADANGRMHFLTMNGYDTTNNPSHAGTIFGGTLIEGVPGISMTVGAAPEDPNAEADWEAVAANVDTKKCCQHEETRSVVVRSTVPVALDGTNAIPTSGAFYSFTPTVNGFLTIDAKLCKDHTIVLLSDASEKGAEDDETVKVTAAWSADPATYGYTAADFDGEGNLLADYTFKKPLLVGNTYYLYDVTNSVELNLHGFSYQPAFVFGRSTTKAQSEAPIAASTFMNGLTSSVPVLKNSNQDDLVTFTVTNEATNTPAVDVTATDYLEVGSTGGLTPKQMTLDNSGNIFKLRVKANVASKDATLGSCVTKTAMYDISIIDIPTYAVGATQADYDNFEAGKEVETTNIKTDLVMTFGGWGIDDGKYEPDTDNPDGKKTDSWTYKSKAGAHSRIGSELDDDDLTYNKTIDGFEYFMAGNNNPIDELNGSALQNATLKDGSNNPRGYNGGSYTYRSGVTYEAEAEGSTFYNTTYKVPCRGAFLKFEPRESGVLLVYLVQNGSCDYHYGVTSIEKQYQIKWRPLYITDETGKPVVMADNFSGISQYLPASEITHTGSYTLGVSRCGPDPIEIRQAWDYAGASAEKKFSGSAFDWSEFKGTDDDKTRLIQNWPAKGEREHIIRLKNGGFVLAHKAYVRYAFHVKAGKTYFVFQPGSKPEFGGFSFVPAGYPNNCKYTLASKPNSYEFNTTNQEKNWNEDAAKTNEVSYASGVQTADDPQTLITDNTLSGETKKTGRDFHFTWDQTSTVFTADRENLVITINDRRKSEIGSDETIIPRSFVANEWESLCLPFSVSSQEMKRVFGDDYVLVTCDGVVSNSDQRLHFVRHGNTYLEAGRPYFIKPSKAVTALSFRNVTIEGGTKVGENEVGGVNYDQRNVSVVDRERFNVNVNTNEFTFMGTYMRTTVPEGSYIMATVGDNNGLHRVGAAEAGQVLKIGGYRSFFKANTNNTQSLLAYFVSDYSEGGTEGNGDDITGVISVDAVGNIDEVPVDAGVYNVSGQKVGDSPLDFNKATNGVYIINGKKYIK